MMNGVLTPEIAQPAPLFAGLDGCRAGWLAARWRPDSGGLDFTVEAHWPAGLIEEAALVAVDMPIGLPEEGNRPCDLQAREFLPAKSKPRVFLGLRRPLFRFATYREADGWGKAAQGKGLSKQAWFLLPKIRELDAVARVQGQERLREVHPELVFHALSGGEPLARKKTALGRRQRLALLQATGLGAVETWLNRFPRRAVQPDDLLDASACALAARRIHQGQALRVPTGAPPLDGCGLRMEIWF